MKIVIDVPDAQYEYLAKIAIAGEEPLGYFERVIMRGTPLPKGHGDLIDANVLAKHFKEVMDTVMKKSKFRKDEEYILRTSAEVRMQIKGADVIIKADKEIEE